MARKDKSTDNEDIANAAEELQEVQLPNDEPDLTGLIKMTRGGKIIHAHPTVVEEHISNGWEHA